MLGRFLAADSAGGARFDRPDALDLCAYCLNDPVNHLDPTGHGTVGRHRGLLHRYASQFGMKAVTVFAGATNAVSNFFQSRIGKIVTTSIVSGVLIVGGLAVFAVPPLFGPFAPLVNVLGATRHRAGLAGASYLIISGGTCRLPKMGHPSRHRRGGRSSSPAASAPVPVAAFDSVASAGAGRLLSAATTGRFLAGGTVGRFVANIAVAGLANAVGGGLGQVLNNVVAGKAGGEPGSAAPSCSRARSGQGRRRRPPPPPGKEEGRLVLRQPRP